MNYKLVGFVIALVLGVITTIAYFYGNQTIDKNQINSINEPVLGIATVNAKIEVELIIPSPTPTPPPPPPPKPSPTILPTPTPTTPVVKQPSNDKLNDWFEEFSNLFKVEKELLMKIAKCESGYNADSHNVKHDYAGMYQFSKGTWESTRYAMGLDPDPKLRFNPKEAIKTAAFKISRGGAGAWPNCN